MSINESIMKQLATLEQSAAEQMAAITEMRKALGMGEFILPSSASSATGKSKKGRKSKKAAPAEGEAEQAPKEKGPPSAWNTLIASTVADMRSNGWPAWTDLKEVTWPASRRGMVKDKSGAEREAYVFDGGEYDGKEPTQAIGGMVRASYLKCLTDPEAAEKARKHHAKLAEKRSAASSASAGSGEKDAPVADEPTVVAPKKGAGRPKQTDAQKAAAKAEREAKKAAESKAAAAEPKAEVAAPAADEFTEPAAPVEAAAPPAKKGGVLKVKSAPAPPKKVDLTFIKMTHEGVEYLTNDRKDMLTPEGDWVGRFDGKAIDTSVPEPTDLEGVEMRE